MYVFQSVSLSMCVSMLSLCFCVSLSQCFSLYPCVFLYLSVDVSLSSRLQTDAFHLSVGLPLGPHFGFACTLPKKYSSRLPSKLIGELQLWQASLPLWQQSCVDSTNPEKNWCNRQWVRGSREKERERGNREGKREDLGIVEEHRIQ